MSVEQNKAVVTRIYTEVNDAKHYEVLDELCNADVIVHDPLAGDSQGIESYRSLFAFFGQAFPKQYTELHQFIAEGNYVAVLHTHHATNDGSFNGMPATHRTVVVPGIELYRFVNGRIVEFWRLDADYSLMVQLGAIAAPQPS